MINPFNQGFNKLELAYIHHLNFIQFYRYIITRLIFSRNSLNRYIILIVVKALSFLQSMSWINAICI